MKRYDEHYLNKHSPEWCNAQEVENLTPHASADNRQVGKQQVRTTAYFLHQVKNRSIIHCVNQWCEPVTNFLECSGKPQCGCGCPPGWLGFHALRLTLCWRIGSQWASPRTPDSCRCHQASWPLFPSSYHTSAASIAWIGSPHWSRIRTTAYGYSR